VPDGSPPPNQATKGTAMPSNKKFYLVIIEVTVLSEHPFPGHDGFSLQTVAENIDAGDDVGKVKVISNSEIDATQAVKELNELGSEPGFFQLTEAGEDAE